jgi:hypothetical protein
MIIDLDADYSKQEKTEIIENTIVDVKVNDAPITEKPADTTKPTQEVTLDDKQQAMIRDIEEKENYIRYQRAIAHQQYRKLLGPDLRPAKGVTDDDFLVIYEQIDSYTDDLKNLYIKKQQIEKFGELRPQKVLSNEDLARISALKHKRSRVNDNLYKARKAQKVAEAKGAQVKLQNTVLKIQQLELEYMDIQNQLKKLENAV